MRTMKAVGERSTRRASQYTPWLRFQAGGRDHLLMGTQGVRGDDSIGRYDDDLVNKQV